MMVAHLFLKKLRLPGHVESQVITGAPNQYKYEGASSHLPRISVLWRDGEPSGGGSGHGHGGRYHAQHGGPAPRKLHHGKPPHRARTADHDVNLDIEADADDHEESNDPRSLLATRATTTSTTSSASPMGLQEAIAEHEAFITQA